MISERQMNPGAEMRWFIFGAEGVKLSGKDWATVTKDPEDMLASIALGAQVHRACLRRAGLPAEKGDESTIIAFAHILHHTLDEMDEERWLELRWHLQEGWRRSDMALWESPERWLAPLGKEKEILPMVLSLQSSMENVLRPELFRLLWCMLTAAERKTPWYALETRDAKGGLLFPLMLLEQLCSDNVPPFLDEEENDGMAHLRRTLRFSGRLSNDELLDALSSRKYQVRGAKLFLESYLRPGGEWFTGAEIRGWQERCSRSCALLFAFRAMFIASVVGESGPLRIALPD